MTDIRRVLASWVGAVLCGCVLVPGASLAELPPSPVEPGDFYFSAGTSLYFIHTKSFETGRLFLDDNFTGAGMTTSHPRGYLLSHETDNSGVWAPEIQLGFALEEAPFDGKLGSAARWHISAYGYERHGDSTVVFAQPATAYEQLVNPTTMLPEYRDLYLHQAPISGVATLPNGDDPYFFHNFAIENNRVKYDDLFVNTNVMFFFDDPEGAFRLTRGVGLTTGFEKSEWTWNISSPQMSAAAPGLNPSNWNYEFNTNTVYIGPRAEFSYGWEPVRALSMFVNGSFAPMMAVSSVDGVQRGMCLSTCTIAGAASAGTYGVSRLSETDINFAYDARLEVGVSLYLWVLRLTATGGGFASNQFTMPMEQDSGSYDTELASQWGYFLRGMATLSF